MSRKMIISAALILGVFLGSSSATQLKSRSLKQNLAQYYDDSTYSATSPENSANLEQPLATIDAQFAAMSDEELLQLLAYCHAILPGGHEETRARHIKATFGDFGRNDLNGDSTIQPGAEFEGLVDKLFDRYAIAKTEETYQQYFAEIDADGDGSISFQEFLDFFDYLTLHHGIPAMEAELDSRGL